MVLLDNGGYSMMPYFDLVKLIFGKIRDHFKDLKYYYFHNCLYGAVYSNLARRVLFRGKRLFSQGAGGAFIIIGDANMAPYRINGLQRLKNIHFSQVMRKPALNHQKKCP